MTLLPVIATFASKAWGSTVPLQFKVPQKVGMCLDLQCLPNSGVFIPDWAQLPDGGEILQHFQQLERGAERRLLGHQVGALSNSPVPQNPGNHSSLTWRAPFQSSQPQVSPGPAGDVLQDQLMFGGGLIWQNWWSPWLQNLEWRLVNLGKGRGRAGIKEGLWSSLLLAYIPLAHLGHE